VKAFKLYFLIPELVEIKVKKAVEEVFSHGGLPVSMSH
jgi:hypothetical protein